MKCFVYGGAKIEFSIEKVQRFLMGCECVFAL